MQYQVPQFIDVEDKIFGPFTFRQAVYMVGGIGFSYLIYRFTPSLIISAIPMILVMGLSAALAFYKVNNRPFINVLEAAFKYSVAPKLYLWRKKEIVKPAAKTVSEKSNVDALAGIMVPKVSRSKLHDLAWSLDIQERINEGQLSKK